MNIKKMVSIAILLGICNYANSAYLHNMQEEAVWMKYQTETQIGARLWMNSKFDERNEVPKKGVFCDIKIALEIMMDEDVLFLSHVKDSSKRKFKNYLNTCDIDTTTSSVTSKTNEDKNEQEFFSY